MKDQALTDHQNVSRHLLRVMVLTALAPISLELAVLVLLRYAYSSVVISCLSSTEVLSRCIVHT